MKRTATSRRMAESVTSLIGPSATARLKERDADDDDGDEKKKDGKIDYDKTKAPNFSSDNQPGKKK